jgi:integrase
MSTSLALIPSAEESQLNRNVAFRELREMVLNSVASDHSKRNYAKALDDLFAFCASRPLSRPLLMEYRSAMLEKKLSASTVNVRLSAIRKLLGEAQKNGILDAEQAAKMTDVPNLRQQGTGLGNWLTRDQAKELLAVPDRSTIKGKRDYCILALLVGCALRRKELSTLTLDDIQLREGRWVIVDLVGKGGRVRTVAIPVWVKNAINVWQTVAKIEDGRLLRPLSKSGRILGEELGDWAIWRVVEASAKEIGIEHFGAHDLRRTLQSFAERTAATSSKSSFSSATPPSRRPNVIWALSRKLSSL